MIYAQSAFYSSLPFTLSMNSTFYMHSAFNPLVRSLQSVVHNLRFTLTAFDTHAYT